MIDPASGAFDKLMSDSHRQPTRTLHCPQCDGVNRATALRCWLCGATLPVIEGIPKLEAPAPLSLDPVGETSKFSLASLMLFMTLACVLLGVFSIAPGLGVPLAFVAFFAWMRTINIVRIRGFRGAPIGPQEKIQVFLRSFGFTLALLTMIVVAGGASFFAACTAVFAVGMPREIFSSGFVLLGLLALCISVATIVALRKLLRYNRARWRRDTGEPELDPAKAALGISQDDTHSN